MEVSPWSICQSADLADSPDFTLFDESISPTDITSPPLEQTEGADALEKIARGQARRESLIRPATAPAWHPYLPHPMEAPPTIPPKSPSRRGRGAKALGGEAAFGIDESRPSWRLSGITIPSCVHATTQTDFTGHDIDRLRQRASFKMPSWLRRRPRPRQLARRKVMTAREFKGEGIAMIERLARQVARPG